MNVARLTGAMILVLACSVAIAAEPAGADRQMEAPSPENPNDRGASQATPSTERPAPESSEPASASESARSARTAARADRLDLDTTVVTGNRELPKVLYIVPWKKADIGDLPGQPFNTLLDEALTPVDRDVFRREVTYYGAISSESDGVATRPSAAPQRTGGSEK